MIEDNVESPVDAFQPENKRPPECQTIGGRGLILAEPNPSSPLPLMHPGTSRTTLFTNKKSFHSKLDSKDVGLVISSWSSVPHDQGVSPMGAFPQQAFHLAGGIRTISNVKSIPSGIERKTTDPGGMAVPQVLRPISRPKPILSFEDVVEKYGSQESIFKTKPLTEGATTFVNSLGEKLNPGVLNDGVLVESRMQNPHRIEVLKVAVSAALTREHQNTFRWDLTGSSAEDGDRTENRFGHKDSDQETTVHRFSIGRELATLCRIRHRCESARWPPRPSSGVHSRAEFPDFSGSFPRRISTPGRGGVLQGAEERAGLAPRVFPGRNMALPVGQFFGSLSLLWVARGTPLNNTPLAGSRTPVADVVPLADCVGADAAHPPEPVESRCTNGGGGGRPGESAPGVGVAPGSPGGDMTQFPDSRHVSGGVEVTTINGASWLSKRKVIVAWVCCLLLIVSASRHVISGVEVTTINGAAWVCYLLPIVSNCPHISGGAEVTTINGASWLSKRKVIVAWVCRLLPIVSATRHVSGGAEVTSINGASWLSKRKVIVAWVCCLLLIVSASPHISGGDEDTIHTTTLLSVNSTLSVFRCSDNALKSLTSPPPNSPPRPCSAREPGITLLLCNLFVCAVLCLASLPHCPPGGFCPISVLAFLRQTRDMTTEEEPAQEQEIDWTPYAELHLINSLGGLKAIGVNHHFFMAIVWHRFTSAMHVYVSPEALKKRLETYYDFANADKLVAEIPFPNDEVDFSLPEEDFPGLKLHEGPAPPPPPPPSRSDMRSPGKKEVLKRFSSPLGGGGSSGGAGSAKGGPHGTPASGSKRGGGTRSPLTTGGPGESKKRQQSADDKRKVSTPPPSQSPAGAQHADRKQAAVDTPRGYEKKLVKDSRVVLTKGRIDEMPIVKRSMKAEEDRRQSSGSGSSTPVSGGGGGAGTPVSGHAGTGKKRQFGRLSVEASTKPSSPTPMSKRSRH
ncbi:hypothetical protein AAG570_007090 [Ranatra chinensis]|uniref:Uncharacterized protein n=1 Tax=Ranatra chinensis TaxID=642074 RepID=A0ABD0XUY2_9HEMI